jgi:ABC-type uncharacterized transport system auxiliary subunit
MKIPSSYRTAVIGIVLASASCGPAKYARTYILDFPAGATAGAPATESFGSLAVREFQCPQYLCEGRIVYRPTPEEIGFYEFHRWATNPRLMLTQFVAGSIRARGSFQSVTLQESGVESAYVLKGSIDRLEEVDLGTDVQAVCTISAQLIDSSTKSIVWTQTVSQSVAVQNRTIAGVVGGLSTAARMSVENLVGSLDDAMFSKAAGKH